MRSGGGKKLKKPSLEVEAGEAVRSCRSGDKAVEDTWPESPLPETLVIKRNTENSDQDKQDVFARFLTVRTSASRCSR